MQEETLGLGELVIFERLRVEEGIFNRPAYGINGRLLPPDLLPGHRGNAIKVMPCGVIGFKAFESQPVVWIELLLVAYLSVAWVLMASAGFYGALPFVSLFILGYGLVGVGSRREGEIDICARQLVDRLQLSGDGQPRGQVDDALVLPARITGEQIAGYLNRLSLVVADKQPSELIRRLEVALGEGGPELQRCRAIRERLDSQGSCRRKRDVVARHLGSQAAR